ncbi:hypothetical protein PENTCL1PPCAC_24559, partial [Pristionchus entomophagus]
FFLHVVDLSSNALHVRHEFDLQLQLLGSTTMISWIHSSERKSLIQFSRGDVRKQLADPVHALLRFEDNAFPSFFPSHCFRLDATESSVNLALAMAELSLMLSILTFPTKRPHSGEKKTGMREEKEGNPIRFLFR